MFLMEVIWWERGDGYTSKVEHTVVVGTLNCVVLLGHFRKEESIFI